MFFYLSNQFVSLKETSEYKWLTRTIIMATRVTKVIRKAESGLPLRYDIDTLTWKKNVRYRDVVLGEEFESEHLEDGIYLVSANKRFFFFTKITLFQQKKKEENFLFINKRTTL